jgi:outer membrane protein assembly factor BamB
MLAVAATAWGLTLTKAHAGSPGVELARQILAATGVQGGFVVHVGCGDGKLTAALRANERYLVHGLDTDTAKVERARKHIQSLGLYGKVTVDRFDGRHLPYIYNLVNLVVGEDLGPVAMDEAMRVLCPNGVAYVKRGDTWTKTVKPRPKEMDEWTHYLHDASNNAVAQDSLVGPPKHYQWIGTPRWLRHHDHMSGLSAMVSAKGRLFYIIDLGPRWSVQMPPRWTLIARDAFNGVILWQRPIRAWHAHLWPLKKGPAEVTRRLVAVGDTVYVTLGVGEPVTALDAATGKAVMTYRGTEGTQEIILSDGVLYALVDPELDAYKALPRESVGALRRSGAKWNWDERERRLVAVNAASGSVIWQKSQRVAPVSMAAASQRLYLHDGKRVVCLAARNGQPVWASKPIPRWKPMHVLFGPSLVVHEDVVICAGGEKMTPTAGGKDTMTALDAGTGKTLWTAPHPPSGYASPEDVFVVDGLVWCADTTSRRDSGTFTGRDPRTGEVKVKFPRDDGNHMPHHRCHPAKATVRYILTSRTGIEFVDFRSKHWIPHYWVRGSCNYGIMPCNGLVYAPPHSCACYLLAKLNGLNALAPASRTREVPREVPDEGRLVRGPAFGQIGNRKSEIGNPEDWPTYRHDAARSGKTEARVPTALQAQWQAEVGSKLTAPVVAEGKLFVASADTHTLHAINTTTGKPVWAYAAGGRIDSPPTIHRGRVLFGSRDGCVYCLRADDGALVWRFRAAPVDRRLMADEQLESAWPVHGSVLVRDGVIYCVAGRTMWLDGGMRLLRLDAVTGRKLSEPVLDDRNPMTGRSLQDGVRWPNLPTTLPDVLSCDGKHVYMRAQPFDLDGRRTEVVTPRRYDNQKGDTAHLFSPTGFLDDSWWHRSYWMFGKSYISAAGGWYLATYRAPAGRILVVDDSSVYGFGRVPLRYRGTPNAYHLFACSKSPKAINPNPKRPPRRRGSSIYGKVFATRLDYHWSESLPFLVRAMVATDQTLFVAGPPAMADEAEVYGFYGAAEVQAKMVEHVAAFEGRKGAYLMAVSKTDGKKLAAYRLASAPVFDGMAAADGRLFLTTMEGKVLCLGAGDGKPLETAPDVKPGPVSAATPGFFATKAHPDFQRLTAIRVTRSDLGYRMQTGPRQVGLALRKLAAPLTKRAEFRVKVRPTPGAASPDTPGNGFIAFGDAATDDRLVKCGFRIAGKHLYIVQGPLLKGRAQSTPLKPNANEVADLHVIVDLGRQKVTVSMLGKTVKATLRRKLDAITWVGHCINSVTSDFSRIDIKGE